ncbi:MAG: hypothetical protein QXE01_05575 [Sulfolobales archaeon]
MKSIIGIAISSLYIAVILVTITVIVGIAVAAYVGGVINLGISDIEMLYIYPNSSLTYENSSWVLRALIENRDENIFMFKKCLYRLLAEINYG